MSYACRHLVVLAASMLAPAALLAGAGLVAPPDLKIGKNLQSFSGIKLTEPAPKGGMIVTVTSDDPIRVLLSLSPDQPGSKSITLKVNPDYVETPDFCVQALADKGAVTFTATAPGAASVKGKVVLTPSAILMAGPFKASAFDTTPGQISKITFYSAQVDPAGSVEQQPVAGGTVTVDITNSNPKVGETLAPEVKFKPGESSAITGFKPAGAGSTTLAMKIPPGFSTPPKMLSVTATVALPGIGLAGEINLGKDLQMGSAVLLGEAAPAEGLDVTLTSDDPKKLVISAKEDQLGSKSLTIHFAKGEIRASYYLQALSESGTVNYTATAPGYRTRVAPVYLAPSGILVVYKPYGAPDRAEVQRNTRDARPFTIRLASKKPELTLWVVYLDRDTHRGADITVQSLRPGVTPTVELKSSDPAVATVPTTLTLPPLSKNMDVDFTTLSVGKTVISVSTPSGFTTPDNAVTVAATILE
jgi:hypothetical protein